MPSRRELERSSQGREENLSIFLKGMIHIQIEPPYSGALYLVWGFERGLGKFVAEGSSDSCMEPPRAGAISLSKPGAGNQFQQRVVVLGFLEASVWPLHETGMLDCMDVRDSLSRVYLTFLVMRAK